MTGGCGDGDVRLGHATPKSGVGRRLHGDMRCQQPKVALNFYLGIEDTEKATAKPDFAPVSGALAYASIANLKHCTSCVLADSAAFRTSHSANRRGP
jgi:hypothetical protein